MWRNPLRAKGFALHQVGRRSPVMRKPRSFAYSLCQREDGWCWSVYDEDGVTVAGGADRTRAAAEAAVARTLRRAPQQNSDQAA